MNRKEFLLQSLLATGFFTTYRAEKELNFFPDKDDTIRLMLLYTNDQHSRIDPFPDDHPRYAKMGGFAQRASVIEEYKKEFPNLLLLDSGDIFQGTPYFNFFHGALELQLMSKMGYHASTLGNHDFDLGIENLCQQFSHASFDFLNCNYDFSDTPLNGNKKIKAFRIFTFGHLKVGVTGVGIDLSDLVPEKNRKGLRYFDPIEPLNKTARYLKEEERCQLVICLSHLGYQYTTRKISDVVLAENTEHVDIILGGHTHTFLEKPHVVPNRNRQPVYVCQAGWAGIWLGTMEIVYSSYKKFILCANKSKQILCS